MFKFTQVVLCKDSVADRIDYASNSVKQSIKGDLQVMLETSTGMILLKMNNFQYGINPNDQILYEDKDSQFKLMLCLDSVPENTWILKQMIRCRLMHRRASQMIIQGHQNIPKNNALPQYPKLQDPERLKYVPEKKEQSAQKKEQSSQYKLIEASKALSSVLKRLGIFLAQGIQSIGSLLSKKVQTQDHMNISPIIKFLIEKSVGASKKILEYNTQKSAKLFRLAANQIGNIQERIVKTDTGKKLKQNGTLDSAKGNLRVGLQAIVNVYDGISQGYDTVTKGVSKGANQIISARYGKDAGDMALKIAQGYRNIGKMTKAPNDALKKVLVQTAMNQIKKQ